MSPKKNCSDKKPAARAAQSVPTLQGDKWDSNSEEAANLSRKLLNGDIPRHVMLARVIKDYALEYSRFKYSSLRTFIQRVCDSDGSQLGEGKYNSIMTFLVLRIPYINILLYI